MPMTDIDDIEETKRIPIFKSHIKKCFAKLIGASISIAGIITIKGAKLNRNLSELSGTILSFIISLIVSAVLCNNPHGPTLFGPNLICIKAATRLSMITKTRPKMANNAIAAIMMMTASTANTQICGKCAFRKACIHFTIFSKLIIFVLINYFKYFFYHKKNKGKTKFTNCFTLNLFSTSPLCLFPSYPPFLFP